MDPPLVYLQHLQVQLGETGVGVELDVVATGRCIGDDAIAQLHLHSAVTEVARQLALQFGDRGFSFELLGVGAHQMAGAGQGEDITQAGTQLLESLAIPAQVIAGRAIKQLAVTLKIGLAALAQHSQSPPCTDRPSLAGSGQDRPVAPVFCGSGPAAP